MKNTFHEQLRIHWDQLLKSAPPPRRMREMKQRPFSDLQEIVRAKDLQAAKAFLDSVYAGDLYVLTNLVPGEFLQNLKGKLHAFSKQSPSAAHKILEGVPDFHSLVDSPAGPKDGYVALDHSYYFFRFNRDPMEIFPKVDDAWRTIKQLGGFAPDEYVKNRPADRAVDRIQVIHYPKGAGYISAHFDPYQNQRFVWGLELTQIGKDFQTGGFYVYDSSKKKRYVEKEVQPGSVVLFFPALIHGVDIVDEGAKPDWSTADGRWYMALNTVESHHFSDRITATAVPSDF